VKIFIDTSIVVDIERGKEETGSKSSLGISLKQTFAVYWTASTFTISGTLIFR